MAMRMGEMMVVVRAQDFASRTLRRVSSEMAGLSRAQIIAARRADIAFQKSQATSRLFDARREMRQLKFVERRNQIEKDLTHTTRMRSAAVRNLAIAQRNLEGIGGTARGGTARVAEWRAAGQTARMWAVEQDRLNRKLIRYDEIISTMPARIGRFARDQRGLGEALSRSQRNLDAAYNSLSKAQRAELAFNQALRQMPIQRLHDVGHALGGIGRTLQLFGAVGTVAFGVAANAAADFSKEVSLAATQVTEIGASTAAGLRQVDQLSKGILKLSKDYPFAAGEMAKASYEIFSSTSVDNIKDGMKLLEAFARVAVAGGVDIQTATKSSISVLNTFKGATEDVGYTLNRMFAIVRYGRMTFSDFAIMIPKVAAAAYGSGQSLDDMAGIMAFLTRKTGDASIAATQISRAFDLFARKEFEVGLHKINKEFKGMRDARGKLLPLPNVLENILEAFPELARGGKELERFIQTVTRAADPKTKGLLSTAEVRRFFRYVFRDFGLYTDLQNKAVSNNEQFRKSFELMMAAPGTQWDIFVNRIKVGVIAIGNAAIPVFARIGREIAKLLDWWEKLDESTRGTAVKWGVLLSVGALVSGVIFSIIGALLSMTLTLGQGVYRIGKFAASLFGINKALFALRGGAGVLLMLSRLVGFLSAIGIITLALQVKWTGEATAKQFIMGAIAGAGLGFMLGGPGGAVVGAITVPVLLKWIADQPHGPMENAFAQFQKAQEANPSFLDAIDKTFANVGRGRGIEAYKTLKNYVDNAGKAASLTREEFEKQWNALNRLSKTKSPTEKMKRDIRELNPLVVKLFKDYEAGLSKAGKKKTKTQTFDEWIKGIDLGAFKAKMSSINKIMSEAMGSALGDAEAGFDNMFDAAGERARQLADTIESTTKTAWQNLEQLYMNLRDENAQLFGELGQGPWMTNEAFDIAKEWGVAPGVADLTRDLHDQRVAFQDLNSDLVRIAKRGGPKALIDQLKKMGPEGAALIDQIANAKPGQFKSLVAEYKKGQAAIDKATKQDFKSTIEQFRKAGVSMGEAILNGFQEVPIGTWFTKWINTNFPSLIGSAVAVAVAEFNKNNPITVTATGGGPQQTTNKNYVPGMRMPIDPTIFTNPRFRRLLREQQQRGIGTPHRALGGRVRRGHPYMVGERGREMYVPPRSGRIMSNRSTERAMNSDNSRTINVNYNIEGGQPGDADRARRDAFILKQRMKRWL